MLDGGNGGLWKTKPGGSGARRTGVPGPNTLGALTTHHLTVSSWRNSADDSTGRVAAQSKRALTARVPGPNTLGALTTHHLPVSSRRNTADDSTGRLAAQSKRALTAMGPFGLRITSRPRKGCKSVQHVPVRPNLTYEGDGSCVHARRFLNFSFLIKTGFRTVLAPVLFFF